MILVFLILSFKLSVSLTFHPHQEALLVPLRSLLLKWYHQLYSNIKKNLN